MAGRAVNPYTIALTALWAVSACVVAVRAPGHPAWQVVAAVAFLVAGLAALVDLYRTDRPRRGPGPEATPVPGPVPVDGRALTADDLITGWATTAAPVEDRSVTS